MQCFRLCSVVIFARYWGLPQVLLIQTNGTDFLDYLRCIRLYHEQKSPYYPGTITNGGATLN